MLCLTRKVGEEIMINDDIKIMLLRNKKGQVKLGFTAPKKVRIHRSEIYRRIQKEKFNDSRRSVEKSSTEGD